MKNSINTPDYSELPFEELIKRIKELYSENEKLKIELENFSKEELLKLHRAVESSAEAIFITDIDGMINYINPEFTKLYGYTAEEIVGKTTPRILKSGKMTPEKYTYFWNTILNKEIVRGELLNKTKDGRLITVEGSANPILNDENKIIGFIGVQHDITQRKKSEQALLESEALFKTAFMTSPDAVNVNRFSDGLYVLINKGFTEIVGYTEEEAIGKTSFELNIWIDQKNRDILLMELKRRGFVENFEAQFRKKDGGVISGLMRAAIIDINNVPHILSETKDITHQRTRDIAFKQQKSLVDALMFSLPDHIYFKDLESKFIRINKAHSNSLGLASPEEAIGKSDIDFHTAEHAKKSKEDEQKIIKTGEAYFQSEQFVRYKSGEKWILATKMPLRDDKQNIIGTFGVSRDITRQKLAEIALQQSEERFRSVTQSANDAIITVDQKGFVIGWNRGAEKSFGYSADEILGKSLNQIIPEDFMEMHINGMRRVEEGGDKHVIGRTVELFALNKSGKKFPIELSLSEWKSSDGTFFTGIIRDISIRRRTETENKVMTEISRGLTTTDNLDELLILIHRSLSQVVYAENIFVALFDTDTGLFSFPYFVDKLDPVPLPTAMAKSCSAYVYRTLKPYLFSQESFDQLMEQNEVEQIGSSSPSWIGIPLITPSRAIGVLVLQHYELVNVYSENDVRFLSSVGNQIAVAIDRKLSESALQKSEHFLLESQKIAGLGSYNFDITTGRWTSSEILNNIFGIDYKYDRSVTGWLNLIHPSMRDEMTDYINNHVINGNNNFDREYIIVRQSDEAARWVHGKGELLLDSNGKPVSLIGTILDINQRKEAEEEIKLKNELLQMINAEKDKFFSIIAHDLRGPLSAFVAATQIITDEILTMPLEEIKAIATDMKKSAKNIYSLLENLLEWSRLQRGGMDFVPVTLNLRKKVEECVLVLSETATNKNLFIDVEISNDLEVVADNHMFDAIIRNLVSNALKFSTRGGKVVIEAMQKENNYIEILVRDKGIGMTPELIKKLFMINEKSSRPGTEGESSTGLGLLLVKEFVDKHSGKIWFESEVGSGSTFRFTIPGK